MLPNPPFSSETTFIKSIVLNPARKFSLILASNLARFSACFTLSSSLKKGFLNASIAYLKGAPTTSNAVPVALVISLDRPAVFPIPPSNMPIGPPTSSPLFLKKSLVCSPIPPFLVIWKNPSPRPDAARPAPPTIAATVAADIPPAAAPPPAAALPPPSKDLIPRPVSSKSNPPSSIPSWSNPPPPPSPSPPPSSFFCGPLVSDRPAESFLLSSFLSALANFASSNAFLLNSVCASTDSLIIVRDPVVLVDCSRLALDND